MFPRLRLVLTKFEFWVKQNGFWPPSGLAPSLAVAEASGSSELHKSPSQSTSVLEEIWKDGFLWGVPKSRKSIEKRLMKKIGCSDRWPTKLLIPRKNLLVCNACGHYYEVGRLCSNCYEKVKLETKQMQEVVQKELCINPVEKEVVILYEGEDAEQEDDALSDKKIVEMKKERPAWFSKNLLQRTTTPSTDTSTTVKPKELG